MPQTSFTLDPAIGLEGQIADSGPVDALSGAVAAAAGVNAGRFVKFGATAGTFDVLSASNDTIQGVSIKRFEKEPSTPDFAQYEEVSVMRKGRIFLKCVGAIAAGDTPYVIYTGANLGMVSHTNTNAIGPVAGLQCIVGAADQGIGEFEVNFPQ